jgi:transmembrane sensor
MSADRELITIEEKAADWLVERDRGLSREREREFAQWLAVDPRHAIIFNALTETWSFIGEARPVAIESDACADAPQRRRRAWLPVTLAAAAAVAVACLGAWRFAEVRRSESASPFAMASATEVGALRKLALPDGSVIQLNTDSAVDVRFTPGERRVALSRGEAYFTVAKNPDRPFIVSVAGVDVRVVGTVFNVRLRPEAVDVLVTEGKVRVDSAAVAAIRPNPAPEDTGPSELTAGQRLSIDLQATPTAPGAKRAELSAGEIKQALAWQARRLDFDATPLEEIVAEMNRYNRHKLVIADPRLNAQRFGGSFPAGDCDTIVRMLEANFGIVAEHVGDETRLRLKAR